MRTFFVVWLVVVDVVDRAQCLPCQKIWIHFKLLWKILLLKRKCVYSILCGNNINMNMLLSLIIQSWFATVAVDIIIITITRSHAIPFISFQTFVRDLFWYVSFLLVRIHFARNAHNNIFFDLAQTLNYVIILLYWENDQMVNHDKIPRFFFLPYSTAIEI